MIKWIALACAILLEVSAAISLKAALGSPNLYMFVVLGYSGSLAALFVSLRKGMPLGVGYGIWGACGVALTAIFSASIFNEPLTSMMAFGISLTIAGVLLVELGSQAEKRKETK